MPLIISPILPAVPLKYEFMKLPTAAPVLPPIRSAIVPPNPPAISLNLDAQFPSPFNISPIPSAVLIQPPALLPPKKLPATPPIPFIISQPVALPPSPLPPPWNIPMILPIALPAPSLPNILPIMAAPLV